MRTVFVLLALLFAAGPLDAQRLTAADSAALARAAAEHLRREVLPVWGDDEPILLRTPPSAFDSAVARLIADAPELRAPVADSTHALWMSTLGIRMRGDTAAVAVEFSRCEGGADLLNWWEHEQEHEFVPDGEGWRFVRVRPVRDTDGHCGPETKEMLQETTKALPDRKPPPKPAGAP